MKRSPPQTTMAPGWALLISSTSASIVGSVGRHLDVRLGRNVAVLERGLHRAGTVAPVVGVVVEYGNTGGLARDIGGEHVGGEVVRNPQAEQARNRPGIVGQQSRVPVGDSDLRHAGGVALTALAGIPIPSSMTAMAPSWIAFCTFVAA